MVDGLVVLVVLIVLSCRLENLSFRCLFWLGFMLVVTFVVLVGCLLIVEVVADGGFGFGVVGCSELLVCWVFAVCLVLACAVMVCSFSCLVGLWLAYWYLMVWWLFA